MNITSNDHVWIIRTRSCRSIAEAIEREARETGAAVHVWTMEDHLQRPAKEFPRSLADEIRADHATVSFYIGDGQPGELAFRLPLLRFVADELRLRHGHMIDITEEVMADGMAGATTRSTE